MQSDLGGARSSTLSFSGMSFDNSNQLIHDYRAQALQCTTHDCIIIIELHITTVRCGSPDVRVGHAPALARACIPLALRIRAHVQDKQDGNPRYKDNANETGRGVGRDVEATRPLVIKNTNIGVTTLASGQTLPTATQMAAALQQLRESSSIGTQASPVRSTVLPITMSVSCRVVDPSATRKKDAKTFMLRGIHFSSLNHLKQEIYRQLGSAVVSNDLSFDVGYIKGQTKLCMHSNDDLMEVWHNLEKGGTCTLWCEGVEVNKGSLKKPSALLSSDSEEEVVKPRERKKKAVSALERRIEDNIRRLHDQHGNNFSKV